MPERALVAVEQRLTETVVTCSVHGDLEEGHERDHLQLVAFAHAEQWHDGDVDREGWA